MARHYSSKDFFRQMPNALLARYFQGRGLFGDLDFAAMKETKPDELFTAWLGLPDNQRNEKYPNAKPYLRSFGLEGWRDCDYRKSNGININCHGWNWMFDGTYKIR